MIDCHIHSSFSGDSSASPAAQVQAGLQKGLQALCFTEHYDADYPDSHVDFTLDTTPYLQSLAALQEAYPEIPLLAGVELGLQPHLVDLYKDYCQEYPFDFVIGSTHLVEGADPYYPAFWESRTVRSALEAYFSVTLENIRLHHCFDSYGHLDYMIRYIPKGSKAFSYLDYTDLIDQCLRLLIQKGCALEVNTGGYKAGLDAPNPSRDILLRYRQLGGELLTTGSDAHEPLYVGYCMDRAYALIRDCGFSYVTLYQKRKPQMLPL